MLSGAAHELREEAGFTLIELLVASAAAIVIMFGLMTLLITVLDQTQATFTRVGSTRLARIAFATIENDLHSACVASGSTGTFAPIQSASDSNDLIFVTYTGPSINPTPTWNELSLTSTHTLTDTTETMTANASGGWTPVASSAATRTMLSNVTPISGTPAFQYFAYTATAAPDGEDWWTIPNGVDGYPNGTVPTAAPLSTPLTSSTALETVEVIVSLNVGTTSSSLTNANDAGTTDPIVDAVDLRLTTPPDEAPAGSQKDYGPCE